MLPLEFMTLIDKHMLMYFAESRPDSVLKQQMIMFGLENKNELDPKKLLVL